MYAEYEAKIHIISRYYPFHYAPYVSDIKDFQDHPLSFDMGKPFLPFEQLLAVLPAASRKLLPETFQNLMIMEQSPIIDYYPLKFKTDLNGKKQDWEAVVLIPFIDEVCGLFLYEDTISVNRKIIALNSEFVDAVFKFPLY